MKGCEEFRGLVFRTILQRHAFRFRIQTLVDIRCMTIEENHGDAGSHE